MRWMKKWRRQEPLLCVLALQEKQRKTRQEKQKKMSLKAE